MQTGLAMPLLAARVALMCKKQRIPTKGLVSNSLVVYTFVVALSVLAALLVIVQGYSLDIDLLPGVIALSQQSLSK